VGRDALTEALGPAAAQQVVRPQHAEAFAAKVRAIVQNPDLAAELGQSNRRRVEQLFRPQEMVERYRRLYLSLAADESRG
jgi:glycosyltransferase involved in cell wall biosynthesis